MRQDAQDFEGRLIRDYATTVTILEHLSDAVFILNPAGEIEYANKIALDALRLDLPALAGCRITDFLSWHDEQINEVAAAEPQSILNMIVNHQLPPEMEVMIGSAGKEIPVLFSFGAVRNTRDEVVFIIASAKDISIRRELENEIKRQQAFNITRYRFRELGEQAIRMVHDISQPLTSIRLMVELTQKVLAAPTMDAERIRSNLSSMISSLDIMTASVDRVRNFAFRTEDDSSKTVDVMRIINDATDSLKYELTESDIRIKTDALDAPCFIYANPIQIQRVFETTLRHLMKAATAQSQQAEQERLICIRPINVEDKWLQIFIYLPDVSLPPNLKNDEYQSLSSNSSGSNDLDTINMILVSIGGDLQAHTRESQLISFRLRLPLDQKEERTQLMNLIELMRK